ncbi:MAG TPA: NRDE family protein [Thermoanaerobaculia bacterium]|nr:NRDE family protein [Thermoanaerobaculia bacterium]
MCLIAVAKGSQKFPLVIAANRDEFYARPTRAAHAWDDDPRVIGGRDLRAGGSWLALRRGGRFAAITNVRGAGRAEGEGAPSRGLLVADFVRGDQSPMQYARSIRGDAYAGFHLIVGDGEIVHCSNSGIVGTIDGLFAVSNAPPGVHWEKVDVAREFVSKAIARHERAEDLAEDLLRFLSTPRGGPIEREVFVSLPAYGTRSSTVIVGDLFVEQNYGPTGARDGAAVRFR